MNKKWIVAVLVVIVLGVVAAYLLSAYPKKTAVTVQPQSDVATSTHPPINTPRPDLSPEKQAVLKAIAARMTAVMESKDAKKIRAFTLSIYPSKEQKDALAKVTDAQLLQSAQIFVQAKGGDSLIKVLAALPDSAWLVGSSTATITQDAGNGRKAVFTATKVNDTWQ